MAKKTKVRNKKTHDSGGAYEHFNATSYRNSQNLRKLILSSLNRFAEKYDADPITFRSRGYISNFNSRKWSWRSEFFRKYLNYVESTHRQEPERYWLDCLIRQCGYMVWNLTYNTIIQEYKNGDKWPGADNLPRKQRAAGSVAEHFANLDEEIFFQNFK